MGPEELRAMELDPDSIDWRQAPVYDATQEGDIDPNALLDTALSPDTSSGSAQAMRIAPDAAKKNGPDVNADAAGDTEPVVDKNNALHIHAGLPTCADLAMMGRQADSKKLHKHSAMARVLTALDAYHALMGAALPLDLTKFSESRNNSGIYDADIAARVQALDQVIRACRVMIDNQTGSFSRLWYGRSSTLSAMLPAVSSLLMQAYQVMPTVVNLSRIATDYAMESGKSSFSAADLVSSYQGRALRGTMTSRSEQNAQIGPDKASGVHEAYEQGYVDSLENQGGDAQYLNNLGVVTRRVIEKQGEPAFADAGELERRQLDQWTLPNPDSADFLEELQRVMSLIDDMEMHYATGVDRRSGRPEYIQLSRHIGFLLSNRDYLSPEVFASEDMPKDLKAQLLQSISVLRSVAGKPVAKAIESIRDAEKTSSYSLQGRAFWDEKNETGTKGSDLTVLRGALSEAWIDKRAHQVFRSVQTSTGGMEGQQKEFNGNYDEAMAKLGQLFQFNVIVDSRSGYYTNVNGTQQYGSIMEESRGVSAGEEGLQFGMFGQGKKDIFENPRLVTDLMKMDVLDFIARHTDRHLGNFYINPDAPQGQSTVTAIDDDMVFNTQVDEFLQSRGGSAYNSSGMEHVGHLLSLRTHDPYDELTVNLDSAFRYILPEVRDGVLRVSPEEIDAVLRPYVSRPARFAAIDRFKKLRAYVEGTSTIANPQTGENMQAFQKHVGHKLIDAQLSYMSAESKTGLLATFSSVFRRSGSALLRMISANIYDDKAALTGFVKAALANGSITKEELMAGVSESGRPGVRRILFGED